jgi:hypothetical protein
VREVARIKAAAREAFQIWGSLIMGPEDFLDDEFIHDALEAGELDGLGLIDPDEREAYYGDKSNDQGSGSQTGCALALLFWGSLLATILHKFWVVYCTHIT